MAVKGPKGSELHSFASAADDSFASAADDNDNWLEYFGIASDYKGGRRS